MLMVALKGGALRQVPYAQDTGIARRAAAGAFPVADGQEFMTS